MRKTALFGLLLLAPLSAPPAIAGNFAGRCSGEISTTRPSSLDVTFSVTARGSTKLVSNDCAILAGAGGSARSITVSGHKNVPDGMTAQLLARPGVGEIQTFSIETGTGNWTKVIQVPGGKVGNVLNLNLLLKGEDEAVVSITSITFNR